MRLTLIYSESCHQVINIQSSFFQLEKKNGKIVNSPEQKSFQIMNDFKAEGFTLYGKDNKLIYSYKKTKKE